MFDPAASLRRAVVGASRASAVRDLVAKASVSESVARKFVAGDTAADAVAAARDLDGRGLRSSIAYLAPTPTTVQEARANRDVHLDLLADLADAHLAEGEHADVTVRLSALGQSLPGGSQMARSHLRVLCQAAAMAGTAVVVATEDLATLDDTLDTVDAVRAEFPRTGVTLQANLRRTETDLERFAGARVRLVKGGYPETMQDAIQDSGEIDMAYVKYMRRLLEADGDPMLASQDARVADIAGSIADRELRRRDSYELQYYLGLGADRAQKLADEGHRVRVYVPFGAEWYDYVVQRSVAHPGDVAAMIRRRKQS